MNSEPQQERNQQQQQTSPTHHTTQHAHAYTNEHFLLWKIFQEYQQDYRRQRLWRNIWRVVLVFLVLIGIYSCQQSGKEMISGEHTALINLSGEIGGNHLDQTKILIQGMESAYQDSNVKGIIIRANSPGGSPVVSNTAYQEIRRLKTQYPDIPVYVVAEDMCASGCYYIAAAADKIYADPSSLLGSIGVISGGFDVSELMENIGVKRRLKIAGENKGMGDPFTPETPEQMAIWQSMLDEIHQNFIQAVREGRGKRLKEKQYPDLFSGRVFTGKQAVENGLADGIGNIYSVARDVIKAEQIVDYTPETDDIAGAISRRLNSEVQGQIEQSLHNLNKKVW